MKSCSELAGKVVLLTGASRGIGRAVALGAAAAGATMLICGRDVKALEALADEIVAQAWPAPMIVPINLEGAGVADYETVATHIYTEFGHLDGLVANAAILGDLSSVDCYDPPTWARVFQVNLHSHFLLLQSCLPLLRRALSASIVFTLAAEGLRGKAHWGAYAASKFALRGLMEVLADELEQTPRMRVNAVKPAAAPTTLRRQAYPAADPAGWPPAEASVDAFLRLLGPRGENCHGMILDVEAEAAAAR